MLQCYRTSSVFPEAQIINWHIVLLQGRGHLTPITQLKPYFTRVSGESLSQCEK